MRYLEVRRHSFTKKGEQRGRGSHLSPQGVSAARAVGSDVGPFAYVVVSEAPRTLETALAMGFAVDETLPLGSGYTTPGVAHHDQWRWSMPYVRYGELLQTQRSFAAAIARELELWRWSVARVGEGEAVLIVSHGGSIEPALVEAVPDGDFPNWGAPFSHLDGVRLGFEDDRCVSVEFHRYSAGSGSR
jgi:broad specificity phosphatase PhoE